MLRHLYANPVDGTGAFELCSSVYIVTLPINYCKILRYLNVMEYHNRDKTIVSKLLTGKKQLFLSGFMCYLDNMTILLNGENKVQGFLIQIYISNIQKPLSV